MYTHRKRILISFIIRILQQYLWEFLPGFCPRSIHSILWNKFKVTANTLPFAGFWYLKRKMMCEEVITLQWVGYIYAKLYRRIVLIFSMDAMNSPECSRGPGIMLCKLQWGSHVPVCDGSSICHPHGCWHGHLPLFSGSYGSYTSAMVSASVSLSKFTYCNPNPQR